MPRRTTTMANHSAKQSRRAAPMVQHTTKQRRNKEQDRAFYQGLALQCIVFLVLSAFHYSCGGYTLLVTNVTPSWTVVMQIVAMLPLLHQLIEVARLAYGAWHDRLDYSACLSREIAEKCCIRAAVYIVWAWSTSRLLYLYALYAATLPQPDAPLGTVGDGQTDHAVACAMIYILAYLLLLRFRKSLSTMMLRKMTALWEFAGPTVGVLFREMSPYLEFTKPIYDVALRKMSPHLEFAKPTYDLVLRKVSPYLELANHTLEVMAGKTAQCLGSAKHTFNMLLREKRH